MTKRQRHLAPRSGTIAVLGALLLLGVASGHGPAEVKPAPADRADQSSAGVQQQPDDRGKSVFVAKGCAGCHAVYGYGVDGREGKGGPDLGKKQYYGTYLELAATMWNHYPKMARQMQRVGYELPDFTDHEVSEIVRYLSSLRYIGVPGNERTGRKLLSSKSCRSCHRFGGVGGDVGPEFTAGKDYLSPLALAAALWNHGPEMMQSFEQEHVRRPKFGDRDIVDLVAGIRSYMAPKRVPPDAFDMGNAQRGAALAEEKSCLHCHSSSDGQSSLGPDFGKLDLRYSVTTIAGKMWNHGPKMWETMEREGIEFPTLIQREMADLVTFLYQSKLTDEPGDPIRGARVLDERGCLSCHDVRGQGQHISEDLSELGELVSPLVLAAKMWNHAPEMEAKRTERKVRWPTLTGRQMADLYAYLSTLSTPERAGSESP
jgi:mono/diheme cytochrome c family protein